MVDVSPLLLDAKREYVCQLAEVIGPYMIALINEMYRETRKESKPVISFQRRLREIPQWNANVIHAHVSAIEAKAPWLSDLIAASFVAVVRVLSSIKLRQDRPKIRLKLPTNDAFLHKALTKLARKFYDNPSLLSSARDWSVQVELVRSSIEKAIRDMLPIRDLLQAYIGNVIDDAHTVSPTPGDDGDDDDDDGDDDDDSVAADPPAPADQANIDDLFHGTKPMTTLEETRMISLPESAIPQQPPYAPISTPAASPIPTVHHIQTASPPGSPLGHHHHHATPPPPAAPPLPMHRPPQARTELFSDAEDDDEWKRMTT